MRTEPNLTPEMRQLLARAARERARVKKGRVSGEVALSEVVWPEGPPHPVAIDFAVRRQRLRERKRAA